MLWDNKCREDSLLCLYYNPLGTKGALLYLPIGRYWCAFSHAKRNCGNSPGQAFAL